MWPLLRLTGLGRKAAARWHQLRHHDRQVAAAHQSLLHPQAAYGQTAAAPLAALAQRRPPQRAVKRQIRRLPQVVPEHAEQIIEDPRFRSSPRRLAEAEAAGHDPERLLQQVADQRALDNARRPARVLTWRIQRLGARPAPSARARSTARAGSAAQRPEAPDHTAAAVPAQQPPQARRR